MHQPTHSAPHRLTADRPFWTAVRAALEAAALGMSVPTPDNKVEVMYSVLWEYRHCGVRRWSASQPAASGRQAGKQRRKGLGNHFSYSIILRNNSAAPAASATSRRGILSALRWKVDTDSRPAAGALHCGDSGERRASERWGHAGAAETAGRVALLPWLWRHTALAVSG